MQICFSLNIYISKKSAKAKMVGVVGKQKKIKIGTYKKLVEKENYIWHWI